MKLWHHWFVALLLGYLLGYYFPQIAAMTVGKLLPSGGSK